MNMGLIGALGGMGKGMADVSMQDLQEAKETRLEELRNRNNQQTNSLNNQQRHDFAVQESGISHDYKLDEQNQSNTQELAKLDKTHEYSLAELTQGNADKTAQMREEYKLRGEEPTTDMKNADYWKGQGIDPKKQWEDENSYGGSSTSLQTKIDLMDELGLSDEDKKKAVTGNPTKADLFQTAYKYRLQNDPGASPDDLKAQAMQDAEILASGGKSPAGGRPSFTTMTEALKAAKERYPNVDEKMLRKKLAETYPDLR